MELQAIPVGAEVVDADGERLGSVIAAAAEYIVAEQGFFFPTDFYLPREAIAEVTVGSVRLKVTKADALSHGWAVRQEQTREDVSEGVREPADR